MKKQETRGKMLDMDGRWLCCPQCRKNKRLAQIRPDADGRNLTAYCRNCKSEIVFDIVKGACFESQGQ